MENGSPQKFTRVINWIILLKGVKCKHDNSDCTPALCTMTKHRKVFWGRKAGERGISLLIVISFLLFLC